MPYIDASKREELDPHISLLVRALRAVDDEDIEGVLNYTISEILCRRMKPPDGWRYKWINRTLGVLEAVKLEFYRRLVGPYEDKAIEKNGDIPSYRRE